MQLDAYVSVAFRVCHAVVVHVYRCLALRDVDISYVFFLVVVYDSLVLPRHKNLRSSLLQTLVLVAAASTEDAFVTTTLYAVALDYLIPILHRTIRTQIHHTRVVAVDYVVVSELGEVVDASSLDCGKFH